MKDEPTPEMIAMARRVINENSDYMRGLDRGQRFFSAEEVLRIALAAIQATTEKAAALLREAAAKGVLNGEVWVLHRCADAIESAAHLKEQSNAE